MKLLFVHSNPLTFTVRDLLLLKERYQVRELYWKKQTLVQILSGAYQAVAGAIWSDTIFCWFGVWHAVIPSIIGRMMGKTIIIASCGYDCANMPDIEYGNMRPGIRRYIGLFVFQLATFVITPSKFGKEELIANAKVPARQIIVIPLGFEAVKLDEKVNKQRVALCIGLVERSNLKRKGMETFVKAAQYLPDVKFILIGRHFDDASSYLEQISTDNVTIAGFVNDLSEMLKLGGAIVQVSAHEGFGAAVAEGMLYGCIPVVTRRGSLPEVVDDAGIYVPYDDPKTTALAINRALELGFEARTRAHTRIANCFSLAQRRQQIFQILDELCEQNKSLCEYGQASDL